jgi:hypothetical protein
MTVGIAPASANSYLNVLRNVAASAIAGRISDPRPLLAG